MVQHLEKSASQLRSSLKWEMTISKSDGGSSGPRGGVLSALEAVGDCRGDSVEDRGGVGDCCGVGMVGAD